MATNVVIQASIDEHIRDEAAAILAPTGLTVSNTFCILLPYIAHEKELPFEPLVPNTETIKAMQAARRGKLVTVKNIDNLLENLNTNDCKR